MTDVLLDTPAKLELVRVAIDQDNGFRDALGNETPKPADTIIRGGVNVTGHPIFDPQMRGVFCGTRTCVPEVTDGGDGTAALELPPTQEIERSLGKTIRGTAIPRRRDLVRVDGPQHFARLPEGVRKVFEDRRVEEVVGEKQVLLGTLYANQAAVDAAIDAQLALDLGPRAAAAKQRRDGRSVIGHALGLAKSK